MYRRDNRLIDNQKLQEFANYLYNTEKEDRDFTFVVEGKEFPVHKLVIKHSSDVMREKFEKWEAEGLTKVTIPKITHKLFSRLIQYMYTGMLNLRGFNFEDALVLLNASNEFGYVELTKEIASMVESKDFLNIWSAISFYRLADAYRLQELHNTCVDFIDKHTFEVINSPSFVELETSLLIPLLHRDTFYAKEIEIFKAVKTWLDVHTIEEEVKKEILSTIRLNHITKSEFTDFVEPSKLFPVEVYQVAVEEKRFVERIDPERRHDR